MYLRRRAFLQRGAAALAALTVSPRLIAAADTALVRRGKPKKVIVIGAGLSGLCAAYELDRAGHEVTVLEAQRRSGGRVLTLREPFADGLYADVGPIYIPDTHELPLRYVQAFNLAVNPNLPTGLSPVRLLRGRRLVLTPGTTPDWPQALTAEERELGLGGLLERYEQPLLNSIGNPSAADWSPGAHAVLDRSSLPELLRQQGASEAAIELMTAGWGDLWGDGLASVSALAVLRDLALQSGATQNYRLRGGNDALPRAFAERLRERVIYGAEVMRIEQDARGVRAHFRRGGTPQNLAADRLVCALPFPVLRRLELPSQWSPLKRQAIAQLPSFSAARVSLQMDRRYWIAQGENGAAQTDLGTLSSVYDMSLAQPGPRGILQTYSGGEAARRIAALAEPQRVDFALGEVEKIFPGARKHCEGGIAQCWDEDPYARGASAWFKPGQLSEWGAEIARAEGRVHFAGDHTSPWIRWMQGALHSGLRVAHEINDAA